MNPEDEFEPDYDSATTVEQELAAMQAIVEATEPLDRAAKIRVIRWARDRFAPHA